MPNIFLQWEQEGPRSDAVAFCRKGWRSTHTQWDEQGQGSSSGEGSRGMQELKEAETERPKHPRGVWALGQPSCQPWGQQGHGIWEQRARIPPRQAGSARSAPSPAPGEPKAALGSGTATGGRARNQVPAPKISPAACQQSSVISIQKKTNSGLTPGTDKLPGC